MHDFETHPEFERDVRSSFGRQRLMRLYGATLTRVEPGIVEIQMPFDEQFTQQHGYLHAAVVTALVDSACGYAALTTCPAGVEILTVEYKVNFLAPAVGERVIARGAVSKSGKTLIVTTGEALMILDDKEHHIATMLATMFPVRPRISK